MAGTGPPPKDAKSRIRGNRDPIPTTNLRFEKGEQPPLPTIEVEKDGNLIEFKWPARTEAWWAMWANSPQAEHFGSTDWDFLLDTAIIHARYWRGEVSLGGELRLRVAKFGATPEDRARLRMQFAQADEADAKRTPAAKKSTTRYGKLKALDGGKAPAKKAPAKRAPRKRAASGEG